MFCPKCGTQNVEGAQFCVNCGTQLSFGTTPGANPYQGSQSGLQKNVSALLCYVLGWITGIIFLIIEKDRFVRFHAMQSIISFGAITIISIILSALLPLGLWRIMAVYTILNTLVTLLSLFIWIFMMIKAYQGQWYKLPIVGDMAEKFVK